MNASALWIVDPSVRRPETEGAANVARGWPGPVRHFQPALRPGDGPGPDTGYEAGAIVVMGSAASVTDPHGWLRDLARWLGPLVTGEVERPVLGICFGHQILADVAGGRVSWIHADRTKELGVDRVQLGSSRLLPQGGSLRVVMSHAEEVREPPPDWRVTAHRLADDAQGLEHPRLPIFSFQFHPEAGREFAEYAGIPPDLLDERQREDSRKVLAAFHAQALRWRGDGS